MNGRQKEIIQLDWLTEVKELDKYVFMEFVQKPRSTETKLCLP